MLVSLFQCLRLVLVNVTSGFLWSTYLSAYALVLFQSFLASSLLFQLLLLTLLMLLCEDKTKPLSLFVQWMSHQRADALSCPFDSSRMNDKQQQQQGRENMEEM